MQVNGQNTALLAGWILPEIHQGDLLLRKQLQLMLY